MDNYLEHECLNEDSVHHIRLLLFYIKLPFVLQKTNICNGEHFLRKTVIIKGPVSNSLNKVVVHQDIFIYLFYCYSKIKMDSIITS